jgi:hypothetical protein
LEDDAGFVAREGLSSYTDAEGAPSTASARSICVVTGLIAKYRDPKSGLHYYNRSALNQLKETPPPWLQVFTPHMHEKKNTHTHTAVCSHLFGYILTLRQLSGNAPYFEAIKYMKERRAVREGRASAKVESNEDNQQEASENSESGGEEEEEEEY